MQGITSLLAILQTAMRVAGIPEDKRSQLCENYEAGLRHQYGGQTVRIWVGKEKTIRTERVLRENRIEAALLSGESPESIIKREDVSKRHMRRIRARFA